jgi:hypothetical protein
MLGWAREQAMKYSLRARWTEAVPCPTERHHQTLLLAWVCGEEYITVCVGCPLFSKQLTLSLSFSDSIKDALDTYTQRRTSRLFSQANVPVDESAQGIEGSQLEPAAAPDRPFPSVRLVGDAQNDMIDAHPSLWPPSGDQFIAAVSTESHWQSPMPLPSGRQSSFFPVAVDATGEDIQSTSWHDAGDAPDGGWIDICRVLAPRHVTNLFDNIGSGATRVVPASKANDDFHSTAVDSALWLRQCLKILASLCEGSNTVTQSIVRRFAPVDMLLDLFETPSTQQGDRGQILYCL